MIGIVGFDHHRVQCIVGVNPEERIAVQELYIDLKVEANFLSCVASDQVVDTISYVDLADVCTKVAKERQCALLETLAADILTVLLDQFAINRAWIRIKKPSALPSAEYAVVELCLKR